MNKFNWLLRREVWESRAIWMAPMICASIMILGTLVGAIKTGSVQIDGDFLAQINSELTPEKARGLTIVGLIMMGVPFLITGLFTQFFYVLDSLYAERRDRSILFWRSLPVSDTATVLSKVAVAAIVIPLAAALAMLFTEVVLFVIFSIRTPAALPILGSLWSPSVWAGWTVSALFLVVASGLWFLPAIGWYMLVSAWAPRSPFVFALGVPGGVMFAERLVFGTTNVWHAVASLYSGFPARVLSHGDGSVPIQLEDKHFDVPASALDIVHPLQFLATPELWAYIALGAALIAGAIWLRRYRDTAA